MAKVEFSPIAQKDLENIIVYVAEQNVPATHKIVRELMRKFELLAENPKMGTAKDNFTINLRAFPYKNYIIFYFPMENGIEIYRVLHAARDIDSLFEEFFEGLKP